MYPSGHLFVQEPTRTYSNSVRSVIHRSRLPRARETNRERRDHREQDDARGAEQQRREERAENASVKSPSKGRMLADMTGPAANGLTAAITEATSATFASVGLRHEWQ